MILMEEKLLDHFARLSRASARSRLFAMRAAKDGRPELEKLFLALAESQAMQAQRFLMQIRGTVGSTDDNKEEIVAAELPAAIDEYIHLKKKAEQLGSKALTTVFHHSANVDKILLTMFKNLKEEGPDIEYFVCDFCGFVTTDAPPDNCPICTAPKKRFKKIGTER